MTTTIEDMEVCHHAEGGFCHPNDVRGHCTPLQTTYSCLKFQTLSQEVHIEGTRVKRARALMGTYSLACVSGPIDIGADVKVWRGTGPSQLIDNSACFLDGRAIYAHQDDANVVMWYGVQSALGGPQRLKGSVYSDVGPAWNVGSIERVCTAEGKCRLSAVPYLRAHDTAYLPEQIGWKFSSRWERAPGDSDWLAWNPTSECWVHDGGVRTQLGAMPQTLEGLYIQCVLGAVVGAFLALEHPLSGRVRSVCSALIPSSVRALLPPGALTLVAFLTLGGLGGYLRAHLGRQEQLAIFAPAAAAALGYGALAALDTLQQMERRKKLESALVLVHNAESIGGGGGGGGGGGDWVRRGGVHDHGGIGGGRSWSEPRAVHGGGAGPYTPLVENELETAGAVGGHSPEASHRSPNSPDSPAFAVGDKVVALDSIASQNVPASYAGASGIVVNTDRPHGRFDAIVCFDADRHTGKTWVVPFAHMRLVSLPPGSQPVARPPRHQAALGAPSAAQLQFSPALAANRASEEIEIEIDLTVAVPRSTRGFITPLRQQLDTAAEPTYNDEGESFISNTWEGGAAVVESSPIDEMHTKHVHSAPATLVKLPESQILHLASERAPALVEYAVQVGHLDHETVRLAREFQPRSALQLLSDPSFAVDLKAVPPEQRASLAVSVSQFEMQKKALAQVSSLDCTGVRLSASASI